VRRTWRRRPSRSTSATDRAATSPLTSDRIGDTPVALVTDYLTESGAEFGAPDKSTSLYVFQSDQYLVQVFVPKDGQAVAEKIIGSFDNGVASTALASIPEGGA